MRAVERFGTARMVDEYIAVYERLLAGPAGDDEDGVADAADVPGRRRGA